MMAQTRPRRRSSFNRSARGLGLAQALEHLPDFTELAQHRPQFEANLEGLLHHGLALRQ